MDRDRLFPALAIAALCLPSWAAAAPAFKDVPAKHWAAPAISQATQKGLMRPAAKDRFEPNQPVTRAELAAILIRVIDYLESKGPVKISSSPAKPEIPPQELAVLAKFGPKHPAYATLERLVKSGYLIEDVHGKPFMPTPENIHKPATASEVATALGGVMLRITEKRNALEHPETLQEGDRPETRDPRDTAPRRLPHP